MAVNTSIDLIEPKVNESVIAESRAVFLHRRWWRLVLEVFVYCLAMVLMLEIFFRIAQVGGQEFIKLDSELGCVHIPNKQVIWRLEGFSNDRINSAGFRDSEHSLAKPLSTYRIALLGDSATEGLQVPLKSTYGKILETALNKCHPPRIESACGKKFEVLNFGCSSYSTGQEFLQYRKQVLPYNVDAVILMYNRSDSIENVLDQGNQTNTEIRPYFYFDESGQLTEDASALKANADKFIPNPIWDFLKAHSRIYGVFSQMDLSLTINDSRYRKIRSWFTQAVRARSQGYRAQYPQQDGMQITFALLSQLAHETSMHHQKFIVVTFPNYYGDRSMNQQINALKAYCTSHHICFDDLTPAFLADSTGRDNFLEYHLSARGHALCAQKLAELF